jgi:hypothetical protein
VDSGIWLRKNFGNAAHTSSRRSAGPSDNSSGIWVNASATGFTKTSSRKKATSRATRLKAKDEGARVNMKYDPKPTLTSPLGASDKRVRVMIEPADPEAQARLMSQLDKIGATGVRHIAQGFVSAEVSIADIPGLNEIAHTGILPTKQLR